MDGRGLGGGARLDGGRRLRLCGRRAHVARRDGAELRLRRLSLPKVQVPTCLEQSCVSRWICSGCRWFDGVDGITRWET